MIFLNIILSPVIHPIYLFRILFLCATDNSTMEDHSYIPANNLLTPIYTQNMQGTLSEEKILPLKHLSKLVNKNILLDLNIASSFLDILS